MNNKAIKIKKKKKRRASPCPGVPLLALDYGSNIKPCFLLQQVLKQKEQN
jgi:hypothetical protein